MKEGMINEYEDLKDLLYDIIGINEVDIKHNCPKDFQSCLSYESKKMMHGPYIYLSFIFETIFNEIYFKLIK